MSDPTAAPQLDTAETDRQVPEQAALEAMQGVNQKWREQLNSALNIEASVHVAGGQTTTGNVVGDSLTEATEIYRIAVEADGKNEVLVAFREETEQPFLGDLLEASETGKFLPLTEAFANALIEQLRSSSATAESAGVELAKPEDVSLDEQPIVEVTVQVKVDSGELSVVQLLPLKLVSLLVAGVQTVAPAASPSETIPVQEAEFEALPQEEQAEDGRAPRNLEMLYGLKLDIAVELGRTRMPIREVLKLARGTIIELESLPGDPVDIFVNGRKFAEGEVVVVEEHFGVRITHLVTPEERARNVEETT